MDLATSNKVKKLDKLAWVLDSAIRVPGTSWRIGLDGLIGLVPGIGDLTAGALSSYILLQAVRLGVAPTVVIRMVLNVLLETVVGVIPVVGDLFDFAFRANLRNVKLMQSYLERPEPVTRRSTLTVFLVILGIITVLVLTVWLVISLLSWLIQLI